MALSFLPTELIALILCNKSTSYLVIALWKCGDRLLNRKLASGVHYIHLEDSLLHSSSRYPLVLSCFTNLTYLSINRGYWPLLPSATRLRSELRKLNGSKLKTLRIQSREATFAFTRQASPEESSLDHGEIPWDLSAQFPVLTTLKILPKVPISTNNFGPSLSALPPSLTKLVGLEPEDLFDLQDNTTDLSAMPASLTQWSRLFDKNTLMNASWPDMHLQRSLPKGFDTICVRLSDSACLNPLDDYRTLDLSKQPSKVFFGFEVPLVLSARIIPTLPSTVTQLGLVQVGRSMDWAGIEQVGRTISASNFWPPSLRSLSVTGTVLPEIFLKLLPPYLEELTLHWDHHGFAASQLPRGLLRLKLTLRAWDTPFEDEIVFPPGLLCLTIDGHVEEIADGFFERLPSSLTQLGIPYTEDFIYRDLENAFELPPRLTSFSSGKWKARWFSKLPPTLTSLTIAEIDHSPYKSVDACEEHYMCLPKGLRSLSLSTSRDSNFSTSSRLFSHLSQLEELYMSQLAVFDKDILKHLRMNPKLKYLQLMVHSLNEEAASFINPNLSFLDLHLQTDDINELEILVRHMPLASVPPMLLSPKQLAHFDRRRAEAIAQAHSFPA